MAVAISAAFLTAMWGCLVAIGASVKVEIMVTSRWIHFDRRQHQRSAFRSCAGLLHGAHTAELLFFMGDTNGTGREAAARREEDRFGDLVRVGGPDSDPPVARDETYVLDRPAARTYRIAHGTAWLAWHRKDLDYVAFVDDDSFVNLPRLMPFLVARGTPSLAMGYLMTTDLDWSRIDVCDICTPCEWCLESASLKEFCSELAAQVPMTLGGCYFALHNCRIFDPDAAQDECVLTKVRGLARLTEYFGSRSTPTWMLGMGWVFGRRLVDFVGTNAKQLKVRGAADVSLGFWLAPLEDVDFVDAQGGVFHDHPAVKSMFAAFCTSRSMLVHRMTSHHWASGFDASRCELACSPE
eukprot:NODE_11340_length_1293_cov_3.372213.p1 GENE.NODE_11340_length_1293_cov_3.372213~~NODE_11340_length_1293_cov_3.372213.p1  ORF type:complete len:353 (+),score=89.76 NODE_11340_length_1293_cov_3.372213:120-1178(+)